MGWIDQMKNMVLSGSKERLSGSKERHSGAYSQATPLDAGDDVEVLESFEADSQTLMKGCFGVVGEINEDGDADIDFFVQGRSGKQFPAWVKADDLHKLKKATEQSSGATDGETSQLDELCSDKTSENCEGGSGQDGLHEQSQSAECDSPSADQDSAPTVEKVRRGVIIRLHGLNGMSHLNGELGLVLYPAKEDRWAVHVDCEEPGVFRNVREQNLEFVCCGGALQPAPQPRLPQQSAPVMEAAVASSVLHQNLEATQPPATGKRKHAPQDADAGLQMSVAEQFAELEREERTYMDQSPLKRRALSKDFQECPAKDGVEGLVQDILKVPASRLLRRLMSASTDDLAQVVSPEATAYVVLARSFRTRSSGA